VTDRVQSIERGVDILMALARGPKTLTEITRETGLSKGTTFRMLASFTYENMVVRSNGNTYMLGPGCLRLIDGVMGGFGTIIGVGRTAIDELWEKTGETVTIHVRVGTDRICIEEVPSAQQIRYTSTVGSSAPLHVGSAGRVLLAFTPQDDLPRTLDTLKASGVKFDTNKLLAELDVVRERGYALSEGERVHGAAAISAPIFGRQGFLAALSVLGPDFRFTEEQRMAFLPDLQRAADVAGKALIRAGEPGANGRVAAT
jgi:DNA-binding IclR family transcriptional regulator